MKNFYEHDYDPYSEKGPEFQLPFDEIDDYEYKGDEYLGDIFDDSYVDFWDPYYDDDYFDEPIFEDGLYSNEPGFFYPYLNEQ